MALDRQCSVTVLGMAELLLLRIRQIRRQRSP